MANNTFTKTGGSFSRKLSPELIEQYFATQNKEVNPLSPLEFQAQQAGQGANLTPGNITPSINETPQTPNYADTFNKVMMSLLKKAQGVDTTELLKRKRALERASLGRAGETTPEELRTLSPQQQSTIRSADVKALSGEIDENAFLLAKAESQIDNFYKSFQAVSKLGADFAEKLPLPESVQKSFVTALQQRPIDDWGTILVGLNDNQKTKVLSDPDLDYSKVKSKPEKISITDQQKLDEASKQANLQTFELEKGLRDADTILADLELGEEGELARIYGRFQQFIPEKTMSGDTAFLFKKLEQMKASIVLFLRAKLKGQGTITDQEQAMLEKASTAISRNLDIKDVKSEVEEMKTFLEFQLSQTQATDSVDNDPLGIL